MLVFDGRRQLILYGTAEGLSADPERLEATKRLRRDFPDDAAFSRELDDTKRVILRITPDTVLMNE